jgi:hypothetical protein
VGSQRPLIEHCTIFQQHDFESAIVNNLRAIPQGDSRVDSERRIALSLLRCAMSVAQTFQNALPTFHFEKLKSLHS